MDDKIYYFKIYDLNLIGKIDDYIYYLYDKDKGWVVDNNHLLSDRLIGYDETEDQDSPYRIGNSDMMSRIEEISEEEANKLIENM